jgi:hypothetical protein
MRIQAIVHQQIFQIKWHIMACLGLVMVLPIEEAVVNLRVGDGFHSIRMMYAAITFSPLLAGLIACANVQGDLNEKRYIFWRSKPVNVKRLMALKFFVGLIVSLAIMACPAIFSVVSTALCGEDLPATPFKYYVPVPVIIAVMTYSLCFGCNVLVRNTARSWLIGMLLVGFVLVFPFMLPLGYKDIVSDMGVWALGFYPAIILVAASSAFVFALYATEYDLHLKTNLRGLLWVGTGLVFLLLVLFSSQIANIKVLQEKEIEISFRRRTLDYVGSRIVFQGNSYIDDGKDGISFSKIGSGEFYPDPYGNMGMDSSGRRIHYGPTVAGYSENIYPQYGQLLYKDAGNEMFLFSIHAYFRSKQRVSHNAGYETVYEKVYLRSYKHAGEGWMPVDELDISDCLTNNKEGIRRAMRLIDNRLIACVNNSCIVLDVTDPGELKLIDKKLDVLKRYRRFAYKDRKEEFAIPIVPIEEIGLQERIRLSIDLSYQFFLRGNRIYKSSIVDIEDGKFAFSFVEHDEVYRYDVTRWDDEKVYCRFSTSRPFTILEDVTGTPGPFNPKFVKNGKLYCYDNHTLLVFDIRSNRRIRKLGHFVRMSYDIEDIAVLEDGNILLCVQWDPEFFARSNEQKNYLYLLKNPE